MPKLERLLQLMTEDFEDQQVMIYVWHIEMQETIKQLLEQQGRRVAILNGSTADRDSIRDGFNDGTYDVIITNAKRSLNLHSGDVCIFYSMETNPATIEQIVHVLTVTWTKAPRPLFYWHTKVREADFFINTVNQRVVDGFDLADIISETVIHFGNLLLESLGRLRYKTGRWRNMKFRKIVAMTLVVVMSATLLAGCGKARTGNATIDKMSPQELGEALVRALNERSQYKTMSEDLQAQVDDLQKKVQGVQFADPEFPAIDKVQDDTGRLTFKKPGDYVKLPDPLYICEQTQLP